MTRPASVPEGAHVQWEIELLDFEMPQVPLESSKNFDSFLWFYRRTRVLTKISSSACNSLCFILQWRWIYNIFHDNVDGLHEWHLKFKLLIILHFNSWSICVWFSSHLSLIQHYSSIAASRSRFWTLHEDTAIDIRKSFGFYVSIIPGNLYEEALACISFIVKIHNYME